MVFGAISPGYTGQVESHVSLFKTLSIEHAKCCQKIAASATQNPILGGVILNLVKPPHCAGQIINVEF